MAVSQDSIRILEFVYENRDSSHSAKSISTATDLDKSHVEECLDYLDESGLVEVDHYIGSGYHSVSITAHGIDQIEEETESGGQNTVGNIDADTVVLQQNVNSDNPTQSNQNDASTNQIIENQPGFLYYFSFIYRWLSENREPREVVLINIFAFIFGVGGLYDYFQSQFIATSGSVRIAVFVIGFILALFGGGYFLAGWLNRCNECGSKFTFFPTDKLKVLNRDERENRPDLLTVEETWRCWRCDHEKTKTRTITDGN